MRKKSGFGMEEVNFRSAYYAAIREGVNKLRELAKQDYETFTSFYEQLQYNLNHLENNLKREIPGSTILDTRGMLEWKYQLLKINSDKSLSVFMRAS